MADFDSPSVPETDISLSVAMKTAFRVAIIFLSFYLLQRFADFGTTVPPSIEAVFRILSVVLVSGLVIRSEKKKYPNQNLSDEAFMSTAFFYGITLASLYAIQIGVIAAELFGNGGMTFQEEIRFVLWIHDFTTKGIVTTFILSHLPYLAYYGIVRAAK